MFPEKTNLEGLFTFETGETPLTDEPPFHILLLGDWSADGEKAELMVRRPVSVDRDNFDEVIRKLNAALELDLNEDGNTLRIEFNELDDFHPDNLYRQVPLFGDLRDVRQRLKNQETFDDAARQVRSWFNFATENSESAENNETQPESVSSENLLDDILSSANRTSTPSNTQTTDNSELGRFISKIISPHLVKIDETQQSELIAAVDAATGDLMRKILHHPKFQTLESAWRGLYFLVKRLETDTDLKIFILDVSKDELASDLQSAESLSESFLYQKLIRETIETPGSDSFTVVGGNFSFGLNVEDVAALMRIAKLSSAANAPFISYIRPEMFGLENFGQAVDYTRFTFTGESKEAKLWSALRSDPEGGYLGLSPMRILGRLPYGENTDSTESFSFEEFNSSARHENYLWVNPCFFCILLLGQSYRINGWEMAQALRRDVENLPVHVYQENTESKSKPPAEILLTENILEKLLEQGLMAILSFRDSDRARLARFQSVSVSSPTLKGRWQ